MVMPDAVRIIRWRLMMPSRTLGKGGVFRRHRSQPVDRVIYLINPVLRGWVHYVAVGNSAERISGRRKPHPEGPAERRLKLSDAERATLGEIGHRLGRKALTEVATVA